MNQLEKNHTYLGFTDNKSPLQKANIENCLDRKVRYTNYNAYCKRLRN